jgi:hypothetical protein
MPAGAVAYAGADGKPVGYSTDGGKTLVRFK